jgi:hypothetical protein
MVVCDLLSVRMFYLRTAHSVLVIRCYNSWSLSGRCFSLIHNGTLDAGRHGVLTLIDDMRDERHLL